MDEKLECQDCGWTGYSDELVALTDDLDDTDFKYCPNCNSEKIKVEG